MTKLSPQPPWRANAAALSILLITAAAAAVLMALALTGGGGPLWEAIGAGSVIVLGGVLALRRLRAESPRLPIAPPAAPRPAPNHLAPFGSMLEAMDEPILLVAGQHGGEPGARRFVFANRAARDLLGIQRDDGPLTTAVRAPEVLAAVDAALSGEAGEAGYEPGGAQDRVWRARATPVPGEAAGMPALALLTFRDETQMRRGERMRADFLANASHELRTPLASLTGFIDTLRGHARNDEAARDAFLTIMHAQAERMRRLIDDLMSLSRIELGEHIPPSGEVDLALATVDVLAALSPLAGERGVAFQPSLPAAGEALITGAHDQILQVIQNLVENAVKYTQPPGRVAVEIAAGLDAQGASAQLCADAAHHCLLTPDHDGAARYILLRLRDQGPGIARDQMPRLAERFYRVEGQRSGGRSGSGLGLAIVKHIVNRHRGGLTVESAQGKGSTFTVYFPMRGARPPAAAVPDEAAG